MKIRKARWSRYAVGKLLRTDYMFYVSTMLLIFIFQKICRIISHKFVEYVFTDCRLVFKPGFQFACGMEDEKWENRMFNGIHLREFAFLWNEILYIIKIFMNILLLNNCFAVFIIGFTYSVLTGLFINVTIRLTLGTNSNV